jgi:hypothetical protein
MGKSTSGPGNNGFAQQGHGDPEAGLHSKIAKATKTKNPLLNVCLCGLRGLLCDISYHRFLR